MSDNYAYLTIDNGRAAVVDPSQADPVLTAVDASLATPRTRRRTQDSDAQSGSAVLAMHHLGSDTRRSGRSRLHLDINRLATIQVRQVRTKQGSRPTTQSLDFSVTPTMRSWNELSAFIEQWEGLRLTA